MSETSYRVLMVDDDRSFAAILRIRFKSFLSPLEFVHLESLTDARRYLKEQSATSFDLIVLDEHLPDGSGIEFLKEGWFKDLAVISISSDATPEIPGEALKAGAAYFLSKVSVSEPLFKPLVLGVLDSNRLRRRLKDALIHSTIIETVQTLANTLRHEINNPLGAVLGAAYLLRNSADASEDQRKAAELVESSGKRIKHVLDRLLDAVSIEAVTKGKQKVFHIPGDKPWDDDN